MARIAHADEYARAGKSILGRRRYATTNIHIPERLPGESFRDYRARREASKRANLLLRFGWSGLSAYQQSWWTNPL